MKIAVIPARGGSKRIPRKNIRPFCGKPMIAWSIEAAQASGLFEHIVVSTDDDEIARVAQSCGAEVPFTRPAELAGDFTTTVEVIAHATEWAVSNGWPVTTVCCIYPTAPFLIPDDLIRGLAALESGDWAYALAATEYAAPIYRSFRRHPDGGVEMVFPEHQSTRSQDLPVVHHDAGQFYWGTARAWREQQPIFGCRSLPLSIPRWRVQDIDTPDDWTRAELMCTQLKGHSS